MRTKLSLIAALLAVLLAAPAGALEVNQLRIAPSQFGRTFDISLGTNKSVLIDLPVEAHEVIVSKPTIAGAVMRSRNRAIVQGVAPGNTNIFFLDAAGNTIAVVDVSVGDLASAFSNLLPGANIRVDSYGSQVALSGTVSSGEDLAQALAIAVSFYGPSNVTSTLQVVGRQQVMIKVTVAEVQRETLKELGVNLSGSLTVGQVNLGLNSPQGAGLGNGDSFSGSLGLPNLQIDAALRALNRRNSIRLLAEPTLTAISGASAHFLAGGEIPFTVTTTEGVTTEWKEFGVELDFTPTIKSNGMISMVVDTAVSELRTDGGLNKRRVASTVELGAGQTLAIGGIMQDVTRQSIGGLPGLGDIPILGALFRSREFLSNQTELVVLVTPYYAQAGAPPITPTDRFTVANDAEAIFLGQMEKLYGAGTLPLSDGEYRGSIGFVLE